ncbi:class I SAM-dependent methyltransferase [Verrucomicrobiaceae bacterium R5-34]|uniref:Class I SAM-dependent methyltransferase n=1 Tax=Oceaniferula flava TaxID=2800421 RepID=A0AAE2SAR1_9BACT|nr:class I SAM-dependent methyltransferase [Oceaniferula flavus]MBK1831372.1 class I SAM-dependent methyltransferase [Verrucomicrobiaceae bacterium R5-34]MBK1854958.1 class I SAM-dependent methyltransferase [Oceaniferula flavus]MBM1136264.1 class I SAM-dependent methyltransferase [Oceaniferula flavus]
MYDQLEASLHDAFWESEGDGAELTLLESFLIDHPGTALELGCGSGRLLLPLIEKGYFIEGLDNSEDMLQLCREQSGDADPVLHHSGIEDFQTGATYASIAIPAFTLQLLPYEQLPAIFENIKRHLHPGGGLYITLFIPWAEITGELEEGAEFLDHETYFPNGNTARCHTTFEIKRISQQLIREHRYEICSEDGKVLETSNSTHHLTWLWPREVAKLLTDAGFSLQKMIGDFDAETPCDEDAQIVTLIAQWHGDEAEADTTQS